MKALWMFILIGSSFMLLWVVVRNRLSWGWLRGFSLHVVMAAALMYVLNYSQVIPDVYIPMNPITLSTVFVLGIPGIALIAGLQWVVV